MPISICRLVGAAGLCLLVFWSLPAKETGSEIPFESDGGTVLTNPAICANQFCHSTFMDSTLNTQGEVEFLNLPTEYVPGQTYDLSGRITGRQFVIGPRIYGFQMAAVFEDLSQAGSLSPVGHELTTVEAAGVELLTHREPLVSGRFDFQWTAPAAGNGPVLLRIAANAANNNGMESGDAISTHQTSLAEEVQVDPDQDGDGVVDLIEDQAPNGGDGNMDGLQDSQQSAVTSLPGHLSESFLTLSAEQDLRLANVSVSPLQPDPPLGAEFPVGMLRFELLNLAPGAETSMEIFLEPAPVLNRAFKFGPSKDEASEHWYALESESVPGVEVGPGKVVLHLRDGDTGDSDLLSNGIIVDPIGLALQQDVFYFPQIGVGTSGDSTFKTDLVFVNAGAAGNLSLEVFESDGLPMSVGLESSQGHSLVGDGLDVQLERGASLEVQLRGLGAISAGYVRVKAGSDVSGVAIFRFEVEDPSGGDSRTLFDSGVPIARPVQEFSMAVRVEAGVSDTGVALVHPVALPGQSPSGGTARLILSLYDQDFNPVDERELEILPGRHMASFVSELFPLLEGPGTDFSGSVTVQADRAIAAVTLRQTTIPTLTAFPVIPGRADREQ